MAEMRILDIAVQLLSVEPVEIEDLPKEREEVKIMHIANEAKMRKQQEANAAEREALAYEEACRQVPFGSLNSYDVVRLWAGSEEPDIVNVGARAREIVKEQRLPLAEFGEGRWVVGHFN